jgi:hypothetical protein
MQTVRWLVESEEMSHGSTAVRALKFGACPITFLAPIGAGQRRSPQPPVRSNPRHLCDKYTGIAAESKSSAYDPKNLCVDGMTNAPPIITIGFESPTCGLF